MKKHTEVEWKHISEGIHQAYCRGEPLRWLARKTSEFHFKGTGRKFCYEAVEYDALCNVGDPLHAINVVLEPRLTDAGHRVWQHENARRAAHE